MSISQDNILNKMMKLGFTNYEARTYLGLLKLSPATGYEISQVAHVPRSVIYSVLKRLEAQGIVISIHDKPRRYIPLAAEEMLKWMESDYNSRIKSLKSDLAEYGNKPDSEGFWNLRGYDSLIQTCEMLIREAHKSVYISGWRREIMLLKDHLANAHRRNVSVVIFTFNEINPPIGETLAYGIPEDKLEQFWDRKLILVTDAKNLVMGPANKREDEQTIWTQNRAALTIATNYIILDITLFGQRIGKDFSHIISVCSAMSSKKSIS
jgi:sugar-specific transcriptional regulator TrmB